MYIRMGIMLSLLTWTMLSVAEPSIRLSAVHGAERISSTGSFKGARTAKIYSAQNETESFQVVVTAEHGNLTDVNAYVSDLCTKDGHRISSDKITLYREVYIPIRHSSPRANCPPGLYPDPLVPFINPYTGEAIKEPKWKENGQEGPRFGAQDFSLWEKHHQPIWIDIHVPKDAAPGLYSGEITVSAKETEPSTLPIKLTVWDFALPDGPTHSNHFGHFGYMTRYSSLKDTPEKLPIIEERYTQMMADHRLNPPMPANLRPKTSDDGSIIITDDVHKQIANFMERYHVTDFEIPGAPFRDPLNADREKAIRHFRSWYSYLEKTGWAERSYLYMLDEPNEPEAYERVRQMANLVHEAEPRMRCLVVEQPYTQDSSWGVLDGSVDIWCPLFGFIDEPSIQRVHANGDDVWSYTALIQRAPPYHPSYEDVKEDNPPYWQMDFPVLSYRIAPWLNRRYEITGLLYWSTVCWSYPDRNPWDDPGFRIRWNGEGQLFYPGEEAGVEGPISCIRLKNLRDGMEDYEYFSILERLGGQATVEKIVREAVPTCGAWNQNPDEILKLRQQLAEAIVSLK